MVERNLSRGQLDATLMVKLAHQESQMESLDQRVAGIESAFASLNNKVDQVISTLARAEGLPRWDLTKLLQSATYGTALVGAFVGSIVWITNASFNAEIQGMQGKIQSIGERSTNYHNDVKERLEMRAQDLDKRQNNMRERLMNLEKYLMQEQAQKGGALEPQLYVSPDDGPPPQPQRYKDERKL